MDYTLEPYVRLYTRDTVEWEMVPWESRALWPNLLRKCDRYGRIPLGKHGARGLAALVKLPVEVVEPGLQGILDVEWAHREGDDLIVPNFIEAQTAIRAGKLRQADYRARLNGSRGVTKRDDSSPNVTNGDEELQGVTRSDSLLYSAVHCLESPPPPADAGAPPVAKRERKVRVMTPDAERIRALIAERTGADPHAPWTFDKLLRQLETGALALDDAEAMVSYLVSPAADGFWRKRGIPPQYVFAPSHVAEILPLARGWRAGTLRTAQAPQRPHSSAGIAAGHSDARRDGDTEMRRCGQCLEYAPHRWTDDGWATEHECAAKAAGDSR